MECTTRFSGDRARDDFNSRADAFVDPVLMNAAINLIVAVAGGVSTELVKDFIRSRLFRSKPESVPEIRVIEQQHPATGDRRLVVQIDSP
jgi:hypothetical protein